MKIAPILLTVVLGAGLGGCSSSTKTASSNTPITSSNVPVNKYCPVDPTSKIDPNITYMYNGKTYGFCCKDCIKEFKKDPAKYAAEAR